MAPVILTGTDAVERVVVIEDKTVSPFWVFPNPVLERLLDGFLLCLCCGGFLMVEYRCLFAIFIIHIIKNAGVTQV
jgi:hypothetical protein